MVGSVIHGRQGNGGGRVGRLRDGDDSAAGRDFDGDLNLAGIRPGLIEDDGAGGVLTRAADLSAGGEILVFLKPSDPLARMAGKLCAN